jgi:hypothetical protein
MEVNLREGTATGDGSDTLSDVEGVITWDVGDRLIGDAERNIFVVAGDDVVRAGAGRDLISFAETFRPVSVDLSAGAARGSVWTASLHGVEDVRGTDLARRDGSGDTIMGDAEGNRIWGGAANDILDGRGGTDEIRGGTGHDICRHGEVVGGCEA